MGILLIPILQLVLDILSLYKMVVIGYLIFSWLDFFGILNRYNKFIYSVHMLLFKITEPVLRRIRIFIPAIGGMDFSPIALFILIHFIQNMIIQIILKVGM
jgi:YggT family protein